jgi:hypothetical protein
MEPPCSGMGPSSSTDDGTIVMRHYATHHD